MQICIAKCPQIGTDGDAMLDRTSLKPSNEAEMLLVEIGLDINPERIFCQKRPGRARRLRQDLSMDDKSSPVDVRMPEEPALPCFYRPVLKSIRRC